MGTDGQYRMVIEESGLFKCTYLCGGCLQGSDAETFLQGTSSWRRRGATYGPMLRHQCAPELIRLVLELIALKSACCFLHRWCCTPR